MGHVIPDVPDEDGVGSGGAFCVMSFRGASFCFSSPTKTTGASKTSTVGRSKNIIKNFQKLCEFSDKYFLDLLKNPDGMFKNGILNCSWDGKYANARVWVSICGIF